MDDDGVKGTSLTNMSFRWTRMLYDWCMEQPDVPSSPVVIDAHDLIHSPEIVLNFCEQTGLDKSLLQFEWNSKEAVEKSDTSAGLSSDATDEQDFHRRLKGRRVFFGRRPRWILILGLRRRNGRLSLVKRLLGLLRRLLGMLCLIMSI